MTGHSNSYLAPMREKRKDFVNGSRQITVTISQEDWLVLRALVCRKKTTLVEVFRTYVKQIIQDLQAEEHESD